MNLDNFDKLCALFANVDLFGGGPPSVPWGAGTAPAADDITQAIRKAAFFLPRVYREGYADKLVREAPGIAARYGDALSPDVVEALAGAVYDHDPALGVRPELRRFLAVISDLFTSFLSQQSRAKISLPLVERLPPLAMFQSRGDNGPFTVPADAVQAVLGAEVGVVSLPSTYRAHPVLWSSLAHETGGHDVTHADPGLLDELADVVMHLFGGPVRWTPQPTPTRLRALVWSYWMDQASADIYGVLNAGPAFMVNLCAFLAAIHHRADPSKPIPYLRSRSGPDSAGGLDPHPTDLLRIHLAIGVIESLDQLATDVRARYVADLEQLAQHCAQGATEITLQGAVPVGTTKIHVRATLPLAEWQAAAREVGELVAGARLRTLGGHGIQEIETWSDIDEEHTQRIREALEQGKSIVHVGNDAQTLSGATLALLDDPSLYDSVTARVNEALDESFHMDEIWGIVRPDRVIVPAPLPAAAQP